MLALASDKMADDRGEETVKSNAAGFPLSQLPTKTSAGRESAKKISSDLTFRQRNTNGKPSGQTGKSGVCFSAPVAIRQRNTHPT